MLYVLGFRDYEFVKIDITWGEYLNQTKNAESLLSFTFLSGRVYYDVGNHRATFYQNKEDAVKILNTLKENSRKVRVLSRIDSLLDDNKWQDFLAHKLTKSHLSKVEEASLIEFIKNKFKPFV